MDKLNNIYTTEPVVSTTPTWGELTRGADLAYIKSSFNFSASFCHNENVKAGWWSDLHTGESLIGKRNIPELLCLIHSEISEALEGHRKDLNDDKLPHRKMLEVELADAVIRILDLAGSQGYDLGGAIAEKIEYNAHRLDHKRESRLGENGKKI